MLLGLVSHLKVSTLINTTSCKRLCAYKANKTCVALTAVLISGTSYVTITNITCTSRVMISDVMISGTYICTKVRFEKLNKK